MEEYIHQPMFTYLGNKRKLLDFIEEQVLDIKRELGKDKLIVMDGFTGSGIVSRMLTKHASELHTNDLELYSDVSSKCFIRQPTEAQKLRIAEHVDRMNALAEHGPLVAGLVTNYYAPEDTANPKEGEVCFYTHENALIIDTLRTYIETDVEPELKEWLLGPLLTQVNIQCNSMGHMCAFFKDKNNVGTFRKSESCWNRVSKPIRVACPVWSPESCQVTCHRESTNDLVKRLPPTFDLIYYDPPYNQHEYSHMYFMLNVIATHKKAEKWTAVTRMPDRKERNISDYNKEASAIKAMTELIEDSLKISKYVLISYNDEGIIGSAKWEKMLEPYDSRKIEKTYKRFVGRNGETGNVSEILYLVRHIKP